MIVQDLEDFSKDSLMVQNKQEIPKNGNEITKQKL